MGRSPCCDENGLKKGPWTPEEDHKLVQYIEKHGHGSWRALPKLAGLNRCGKSCRLRWTNYLRPDIKRGKFSTEEEQAILNLHSVLGNKWSAIATRLPGRTDNEIKNFWNTHLKKKLIQMGFDPMTHRPRTDIFSSLPHLIALANLKELMDRQPWDDHSVRLQQAEAVEMAKLQCLQYLLRSATDTNINMSDTNISNIMEPITMDATSLTQFSNFHQDQAMHVPCNVPNQYHQLDQTGLASVVRQEEENNMNQTSSVSPESCVLPPLTDVSIGNTGDACSTSSYDGCGTASNGALWHDLFMDDSFITPFV